jgi:hypothetical protein
MNLRKGQLAAQPWLIEARHKRREIMKGDRKKLTTVAVAPSPTIRMS